MRVRVVCNDTRGGVQPYVALAAGLRAAGHDVRAIAPSDFVSMFEAVSIPCAGLSGRIEDVARASAGTVGRGPIAGMRHAARELAGRAEGWGRETLAACEDAEVITGGIGGMILGLSVAEKLGVPFVETQLQPIGVPTDAYPGVLFASTPRWLGGWALRMSHRLSEAAVWMPFGAAIAATRRSLGLRGRGKRTGDGPVLYGFSHHVVPIPTTGDRTRHATGYWTSRSSWTPPPALARFLAAPGPVVSIGFGSMAAEDPTQLTDLVLAAVRRARVRAILLAGWGGLRTEDEPDVYCADALPHDWLMPRVAAVVHHGGAGTTGAAWQSGTPAVVVPFSVDQPFWASRVVALGTGPAPIPRPALTAERLADAIACCISDHEMRERAARLGALLRAEDGVANAVAHFDRSIARAA